MRRRVIRLVALTVLAAAAGCDGGGAESSIELTAPPSDAAVEETFGAAVDTTLRADPSSEPLDPAAADVPPVDYTAEPVAIPAN